MIRPCSWASGSLIRPCSSADQVRHRRHRPAGHGARPSSRAGRLAGVAIQARSLPRRRPGAPCDVPRLLRRFFGDRAVQCQSPESMISPAVSCFVAVVGFTATSWIRWSPRADLLNGRAAAWGGRGKANGFSGSASRRRDLGGRDRPAAPEPFDAYAAAPPPCRKRKSVPLDPHPVQHGRQLAGQRHRGALLGRGAWPPPLPSA